MKTERKTTQRKESNEWTKDGQQRGKTDQWEKRKKKGGATRAAETKVF